MGQVEVKAALDKRLGSHLGPNDCPWQNDRRILCESAFEINNLHMNNYSSYLVRHWLLTEDPPTNCEEQKDRAQVFDIEHVQSGRRTRVQDLSEARAWIESLSGENAKASEAES